MAAGWFKGCYAGHTAQTSCWNNFFDNARITIIILTEFGDLGQAAQCCCTKLNLAWAINFDSLGRQTLLIGNIIKFESSFPYFACRPRAEHNHLIFNSKRKRK